MSFLIVFFTSKKIKPNNKAKSPILSTNKYWRLFWVNWIKLLSIKVKNVTKPINKVIVKRIIINMFF